MQDWLSSGYLIVANRDLYVRNGVTEEDDNSRYYHTEDTVQTEHSPYASQTHPTVQMHDAFNYMSKSDSPMKDAFKMSNPWCITTPPGYSCFYLDPFLFQNDYFATFQGIIDTDKFNNGVDNAQIIFYPKVDHNFEKKGKNDLEKFTDLCKNLEYTTPVLVLCKFTVKLGIQVFIRGRVKLRCIL